MKKIRHVLLYWIVKVFYYGFRLLPFRMVSAIGGCLGYLASYVAPKEKARDNLRQAFVDMNDREINQIIARMYENFGRTLAEFTHSDLLKPDTPGLYVELQGIEILQELKARHQGALLFSAHYGNWEIGPITAGWYGLKLTPIFKESTNTYINKFLHDMRQKTSDSVIAVGHRAGYEIIRALKKGKQIVLLTDQRMSRGIRVPFFNRLAKTGPGIAKLALTTQCPLIPTMVERVKKTHFRVHVFPPLVWDEQSDNPEVEILTRMNAIFEQWIRARPDNWWWQYHRWA